MKPVMINTCCVWCWKPVKVKAPYDELRHKAVCSQPCKDAEMLFKWHFSDEEINRRAHYRELTKGENSD